jgi:hypothetical protein
MAKHEPVNADLAKDCVENYHKIFKGAIDPKIKDAFTSDVVFDKAQLIAWLNTITTNSVKISLGIYTPEFVAKYPTAKVNRLSTFIYPYNTPAAVKAQVGGVSTPAGGDDPFNLAELQP